MQQRVYAIDYQRSFRHPCGYVIAYNSLDIVQKCHPNEKPLFYADVNIWTPTERSISYVSANDQTQIDKAVKKLLRERQFRGTHCFGTFWGIVFHRFVTALLNGDPNPTLDADLTHLCDCLGIPDMPNSFARLAPFEGRLAELLGYEAFGFQYFCIVSPHTIFTQNQE